MNLDTPGGKAMIEAGAEVACDGYDGDMDGWVAFLLPVFAAALSATVECATCGGSGKVRQLRGRAPAVEIHPCAACEGTGRRLAIKEALDE